MWEWIVKNLIGVVIVVLTLVACGHSEVKEAELSQGLPDSITLEDYCANNHCRKDISLKFITDEGIVDEFISTYWPVVQGDTISLLPGEQVLIEADMTNGIVTNFRQVDSILYPEKTLMFTFSQMEEEVTMILHVANPFDEILKYRIDMIDFEGHPHYTSSCPVMSGVSAIEIWHHAIPELKISNFRVLEEDANIICD